MLAVPSVCPLWRIALSAATATGIGLVVLRWRFKELSMRQTALAAFVVGLSVFVWRLSANVPQFNDGPIVLLSPNDLLCPMIIYVCLAMYKALRPPNDRARWEEAQALLTLVAFLVNVLVIERRKVWVQQSA